MSEGPRRLKDHGIARSGAHLGAIGAAEFSALLTSLGPFEPAPRLAAAVSGGADSMALMVLAHAWAKECGGTAEALIVDHGLRPESGGEAAAAARTLSGLGIPAGILSLRGLARGPGLAARARTARYRALSDACRERGILHLLLGHHAADQAETVIMRGLAGSGRQGMAGMAALVETPGLRLLRPLLGVPPGRLRATLLEAGVTWIEDPSNADPRAQRARLRSLRRDRDGSGPATRALVEAAAAYGRQRARDEADAARWLGLHAALRPEGFAVIPPDECPPAALAALVQAISGAAFPPPSRSIESLAGRLRPATAGGVRIMPAGRMGPGFLIVREAGAMRPEVPAEPGAVWDGRFAVASPEPLPQGAMIGALGDDAARFRSRTGLPSAILRTLPAIRLNRALFAVPHLDYPTVQMCADVQLLFCPVRPAAGVSFVPPGDDPASGRNPNLV